jgi:hypothetical protein
MTTQTRSAAWGTHLILTAIILVATFLPLTFINFEKIHPAEDAAMLMRYAVHLAEGYGIVWNIGEKPVDGATDFLFMAMVALLIKSGLSPESAIRSLIFTAHLINALLIYLAGVLIFRVDYRIVFLAALLLVTGNGMFYVATCFGAPVFALFASAAWICVMRMILVRSEWSWAIGYGFFSLLTGMIPIARSEFMNCPPPAGSPRFARGTARGALTRFPLRAGETLRRGSSTAVFL